MIYFIASQNEAEHREHLREVFIRLRKHELTINTAKCVFGEKVVKFLEHLISKDGIAPLPEKVDIIRKIPQPREDRADQMQQRFRSHC